jgi:AmmeMemoRadiSam system protein A
MKPAIQLDPEERKALLRLARDSIAARLRSSPPPALPSSPALSLKAGAFVSLHGPGHRLRGCIGRMQASSPLAPLVQEMAIAAAFEDHRFPPLELEELPGLEIEITVLSPLRPCSHEEIEIGRHGVHIRLRGRAAVFLPQVAPEQGWDRKELLENLCLKAGLPPQAWHDPAAELELFEGLVFGEEGH